MLRSPFPPPAAASASLSPYQWQSNLPNQASQTVPSINHQNQNMLLPREHDEVVLSLWNMDPETSIVRRIVRRKIYEHLSKLPIFLTWDQEERAMIVKYFDEELLAKAGSQVHYMNLSTLKKRLDDFLNDHKNVGAETDRLYGVSSPSTGYTACSGKFSCNMEPSSPDISCTNISSVSDCATPSSNGFRSSLEAMDLMSNSLPGGGLSTSHCYLPDRHHGAVANKSIAPRELDRYGREIVLQPDPAVSTYGTQNRLPTMTSSNHYIGSGDGHFLAGMRKSNMCYRFNREPLNGGLTATKAMPIINAKLVPEKCDMGFMPEDYMCSSGKLMMPSASFGLSDNVHLLDNQANLTVNSSDRYSQFRQQSPIPLHSQPVQPLQKQKYCQQQQHLLVENKLSDPSQSQYFVNGTTQVKRCNTSDQLILESGLISQSWSHVEGPRRKKIPVCDSVQAASSSGISREKVQFSKNQRFLLLYRHAKCCSAQKGECVVRPCIMMKTFLYHISCCNENYCAIRCFEGKNLIIHYEECSSYTCDICAPVRMELEKVLHGMSSSVISANMASTPTVDRVDSQQPPLNCMMTEHPSLCWGQKETGKGPVPVTDLNYLFYGGRVQECQKMSTTTNILADTLKHKGPSFSSNAVDHEHPLSKRTKTEHPSLSRVSQNETAEVSVSAADPVPVRDLNYLFYGGRVQECQKMSTTNILADTLKLKGPSLSSNAVDHEHPLSKRMKMKHPSLSRLRQNETAEMSVSAADHIDLVTDKKNQNHQEVCMSAITTTESMKPDMGPSSSFSHERPAGHCEVTVQDQGMDVTMKLNDELSPTSELTVAQPEQENMQVPLESNVVEPGAKCMTTASSAICPTGKNLGQLKKKGISLIDSFTPEKIREHINSLRPLVGSISHRPSKARSTENAEEKKGTGHVMDASACNLCGMKNLRFEPLTRYCASCSKKVSPKGIYYLIKGSESGSDAQHLLCNKCHRAPGENVKVGGKYVPKANLERRVNYAETDDLYERWIQCGKCDARQHEICALFNISRNEDQACYTCPVCVLQERESGQHEPLPQNTVLGAENLPTTMLSDHIEQRLFRRLKEDRQERANFLEKDFYDVPAAEGLVVRVVSSFIKKVEVQQAFQDIFQKEKYPSEFPYKSKAILLFQKIGGADVCLFAMYVQEYGSECAFPNTRHVCISYLDSVKYFEPNIAAASGEALRTFVYHEILIGYLGYCKKQGFTTCYIWACPPSKRDDYILYCHPKLQKIPKSDKLRKWYQNWIKKAQKEGIVVESTNFYDHLFIRSNECKTKLTAARLPYFDNDFWPGAVEHILKERSKSQKLGGIEDRVLRAARRDTLVENPIDVLLMDKLGDKIRPMKDDFIMVHLQHACKHCCHPILSGKQWVCSVCKNFQLCEECFLLEQNLEKNDRHPISAVEKHFFHEVEVEEFLEDSDGDETMRSEIFDTRLMFLGHCQNFHYQFDTLRRAKHSTMMILYDLHKAAAPPYMSSCIADNDIGRKHELVKNDCHQNSRLSNENHQAMPPKKLASAVVHASKCCDPLCNYPLCGSVKQLFCHGKDCPSHVKGGCRTCTIIKSLLEQGGREHNESECHLPKCCDQIEDSRARSVADSHRRAGGKEKMKKRIKRQNEEKNKREVLELTNPNSEKIEIV